MCGVKKHTFFLSVSIEEKTFFFIIGIYFNVLSMFLLFLTVAFDIVIVVVIDILVFFSCQSICVPLLSLSLTLRDSWKVPTEQKRNKSFICFRFFFFLSFSLLRLLVLK